MAFDGIVTASVVWELRGILEGAKVTRVCQPEKDEIVLCFYRNSSNYRLLISANPQNARIALTTINRENPMNAPVFCMALRKHLVGTTLREIRQSGYDRVVTFVFDGYNEMGDGITRKLVCEIMGRYSNIILLNENDIIMEAAKHVDDRVNSFREVLPARPYKAPPVQNKLVPSLDNIGHVFDGRTSLKGVSAFMVDVVSGFGRGLCDAISRTAGIDPTRPIAELSDNEISALEKTLGEVFSDIENNNYAPFTTENDFHVIGGVFDNNLTPITRFNSVSFALEEFFEDRDRKLRLKNQKANLVKCVSGNIERVEKKIKIYEGDARDAGNYDNYRIKGEILSANMYMLKGGEEALTAPNYYDENCAEITIELNPHRSAAWNLQEYFRLYRRLKSKSENALGNIEKAKTELDYLFTVQSALELADDGNSIGEIREELTGGGYLKGADNGSSKKGAEKSASGGKFGPNGGPGKPGKSGKYNKPKTLMKRPPAIKAEGYMTFDVSDGYTCWVGKNNTQNDRITLKLANPNDIWLHVKNAPGSHVILRASLMGGEFTHDALMDALRLAGQYSSLADAHRAEVDFTRVKYVKKPTGARPGMVIFTNQKTVLVEY